MLKMNNLIFADGNPAGIKSLMSSRNLCKNILRLPLVTANDNVQADIKRELELMGNK
jgi:4-hydroxy-tetrahydrodipicolinate synthase